MLAGVPLLDRNGLFVRRIGLKEATRMVEEGQALPTGGWRDRQPDSRGVQLIVDREVRWSSCSLTDFDARLAAGEYGTADEEYRAKLLLWPSIGDDRAPRVGVR